MNYYCIADITKAFDISPESVKYRIKTGKLKAHKLRRSGNSFHYVIPETELYKLEEFKKREPIPSPFAQPGYYDKNMCVHSYIDDRENHQRVDYREYMQSEEWQKVRRKRLQIDGYKCQMCGTGKNLQVHHITYEHLGQAKELEDLVTLCRECHRGVHNADI